MHRISTELQGAHDSKQTPSMIRKSWSSSSFSRPLNYASEEVRKEPSISRFTRSPIPSLGRRGIAPQNSLRLWDENRRSNS